jgi:hypothetical protein
MTCRVARSAQDHVQIDLVYCCECGSANLEVFHTSRTLAALVPDLRPVQGRVQRGGKPDAIAEEGPRTSLWRRSLENELQSIRRT